MGKISGTPGNFVIFWWHLVGNAQWNFHLSVHVRQKESMWPCQQPGAPRPGFLGRRLRCASIRRACAGSPGPRSPRSADGPVIIISRPVLPDHFLAPWTAVSLASLRRLLKSHFSSVLYLAHSINLDCDPAPSSVHLCLASGRSSPEGCPPPPVFYFIQGLKLSKKEKKQKHLGFFFFAFLISQLKMSRDSTIAAFRRRFDDIP